jgi:hypothetical protein
VEKDTVLVSDIYIENDKIEKDNTCIPSSFMNVTDPDKLVKLRAKKKAPGTQTGATNVDDKKGARSMMAQSKQQTTGKCVPAGLEEAPKEGMEPHPTIPNVYKTKVPFGLRRKEAVKWFARRAMGIAESRLAQEMRAFQKERARHEMIVSVELETLETGKTRRVNTLLDNGCTTTCMDRDYAKAQGFEMKELDSAIVARNADGTPNTKGRITHYVELIMSLGSHRERQELSRVSGKPGYLLATIGCLNTIQKSTGEIRRLYLVGAWRNVI